LPAARVTDPNVAVFLGCAAKNIEESGGGVLLAWVPAEALG
jgi:hypothetical protein